MDGLLIIIIELMYHEGSGNKATEVRTEHSIIKYCTDNFQFPFAVFKMLQKYYNN